MANESNDMCYVLIQGDEKYICAVNHHHDFIKYSESSNFTAFDLSRKLVH